MFVVKKLLITGFDPFGGEKVNPSWETVRRLPPIIGHYTLTKLELPTVFGKAADLLLIEARQLEPDAILCLGQAGGRKGITPEVVAINLREARIPDNEGNRPVNVPVVETGPAAYFSTLPVREMVAAMEKEGISCGLSYSAGAFVCNDVLYSLLHHYHGSSTRVGFIHVPFLPEQARENTPCLSLDTIVRGLTVAIKTL